MKPLLCWFGHRWQMTHINLHRAANLGHLSWFAGIAAKCRRCGCIWDDIANEHGRDTVLTVHDYIAGGNDFQRRMAALDANRKGPRACP